MIVKVHNKQGEVICQVSLDREIGNSHDIEKWLWDTAEHIAHEIEERSEAIGGHFAEHVERKIQNPSWWEKLKRQAAGPPRYFDIPITMFEDYRCLTCDRDTIQPMSRVGPVWAVGYSPEHELGGYSCQNPDCPMHDIVVLKILVDRIDEEPQR